MRILALYSSFGANIKVVWIFAAGVMVVLFTAALIVMGVTLMKRLINS